MTDPKARRLLGRAAPPLEPGQTITPEARQHGGPAYSGRRYVVGERGPEMFVPSQSGIVVASLGQPDVTMREMYDTEKDSNKSLRDIRDTLQKMEDPTGTSGGGTGSGGGGATGGGRGGGPPIDITGGRQGVGSRMPKGQAAQNAQTIYNALRELGHTHEQASAALAHAEQESGFNPTLPGDQGTSLGIWQWRDARDTKRKTAMLNFAKERNLDWRDPRTQALYFDWDLRHGEGKHAGPKYFESKSTTEAVTALNAYERFRGWQQGQRIRYQHGEKYERSMKPGGQITEPPAMSGPQADTGEGDVRQRQSRVAGTRRGGLDPRLSSALGYASAQTGLIVDVTSGGQRMPGAPGATGSHRHDWGRAADFNLIDPKTGAVVNPNDPRAIAFYEHAARGGVTGGSHSYMSDPNKIHLDISGGPYQKILSDRQYQTFTDALERGRSRLRAEGPIQAARRTVDKGLAPGGSRDGKVSATVDFGEMIKEQESSSAVFKVLKMPSSRMHKPVREGEVLTGDADYSSSVP